MTYSERFWSKVQKTDGCWLWTGDHNGRYGRVAFDGKRRSYAHRVAFELAVRPLAPEELVCHTCDNPRCVRPDHLFAGSQLDNMRDASSKGRLPCDLTAAREARTKLTAEDVALVVAARDTSRKQQRRGLAADVAARFGISQLYVLSIWNRRKAG